MAVDRLLDTKVILVLQIIDYVVLKNKIKCKNHNYQKKSLVKSSLCYCFFIFHLLHQTDTASIYKAYLRSFGNSTPPLQVLRVTNPSRQKRQKDDCYQYSPPRPEDRKL